MTEKGRLLRTKTGLTFNESYVYCHQQGSSCPPCALRYGEPVAELTEFIQAATPEQIQQSYTWLDENMDRYVSFPGAKLYVVDGPSTPLDHFIFIATILMPDAYNLAESLAAQEKWFPAGRMNFSAAAAWQDIDALDMEVQEAFYAIVHHEVDEFTKRDGRHIVDPHPPIEEEIAS